jgi:hypothetical protein
MDAAWNFRHAYNEARKIRDAQDAFCQGIMEQTSKKWWPSWPWQGNTNKDGLGAFPESLQWESLADVLRGRVKVCQLFFWVGYVG